MLELRLAVFAKAGQTQACVDLGEVLVAKAPERLYGWRARSDALRKLGRTEEAKSKLVPVLEWFAEIAEVPYDLAVCCAELGEWDDAREWLTRAPEIDSSAAMKLMALEDKRLDRVWVRSSYF